MQQIGKGIFYEDQYMGVTLGGLVCPHGTIYIDAPLRIDDARSWRASLMAQRSGNHRLLINLDAHPDRTLGTRALDCIVVAHNKTAQVFRNRPTIFKGQTVESGAAWESYNEAVGIRWAPPDVTFSQSMSLFWGGPDVILEHHVGPTPGTTWVILPTEKIIFVGDTVVVHQPPFMASSDLTDWLNSLTLLQTQYKDYFVIGGRGGAASPEAIRAMISGLKNTLKGMERLSKRHASPDATDDLLSGLMDDFSVPTNMRDRYILRLRYGLFQNYSRRYRLANSLDNLRSEENEQ